MVWVPAAAWEGLHRVGGAKNTMWSGNKDQVDPRVVAGKTRAFPGNAFLTIPVCKKPESSCCSALDKEAASSQGKVVLFLERELDPEQYFPTEQR